MSRIVELLCSRRMPQVAVLALMSIGFAGCSGDMQTRLSQDSLSNPFASGSRRHGAASPDRAPRTAAKSPPATAIPIPVTGPAAADRSTAVLSDGQCRRFRRRARAGFLCAARPPAAGNHRHRRPALGSGKPRRRPRGGPRAGQGATTIIVGTSDTLDTLSRRYNVSPAAILQANGYKGPRTLSPGQQLIIPRPTAVVAAPAVAPAPALAAPASRAVAVAAAPTVHVVNHGDTLLSIARRNHVPVGELARANHLEPSAKIRLGMKLTVPGAKTAAVAPAAQPAMAAVAVQPAAAVAAPASRMAAAGGPPQSARLAQATATSKTPRMQRRSRPPRPPARCRHSAGRCAAR